MNIQYAVGPSPLGGLVWVDCGNRADEFIEMAATLGKKSADVVRADLAAGKQVRFGIDWYESLRDADAIKARPQAPRPTNRIKCKVCGEWQPESRFTTLPASAQTCDDCV